MADDLTDILSSDSHELTDDQLLKYVNDELSPEDKHLVEEAMINSGMVRDAIEGLQHAGGKEKLRQIKKYLDSDIHHLIRKREHWRPRRKIKELNWMIIFIVVVLLLILIAYVIVKSGVEI